jgi:hypothetical protein
VNADLETVATEDLIEEIRRRSRVFFCCRRALVGDPSEFFYHWGVEGGARNVPEALARMIGLMEICKFELLHEDEAEGDQDGDDDANT